jgi:N-acetylmuramoyl-L-alanine amidase
METAGAAVARLCDPAARVSAHYVVDEDGAILALVAERARAWHAGVSSWAGRPALNDNAIGVEIVNPGHEHGYRPFPDEQIDALIALCRGVLERHPIPAIGVLAHSDVAPDRKLDPGELFPWRRLARAGIGLWPDAVTSRPCDAVEARRLLEAIGYPVGAGDSGLRSSLTAFQRRFRAEAVTGDLDPESMGRLVDVWDAYQSCAALVRQSSPA